MCGLEWDGSWAIKAFKDKLKAEKMVVEEQDKEDRNEFPLYYYFVREIEADLNE